MSAERRNQLLNLLPDSGLPDDLQGWLQRGMEVQAAGADLLEALELDGPDLDRRDDLLRTVIALSPGESLTARCAFTIACIMGHERHPRTDMQNIIRSLRLVGCPLSIRQLHGRVTKGRRSDGWRERETDMDRNLCPSESMTDTRVSNIKTGP